MSWLICILAISASMLAVADEVKGSKQLERHLLVDEDHDDLDFRRTARSSAIFRNTIKVLKDDGDNNIPASSFPLPECSGDCDSGTDCFGDLQCFDRAGTESVPGCSGLGTKAKDYCYKPNGSNNLAYVGNGALPTRSFPLQKCEGDCDSDSDCASGLTCFQRAGIEIVPGCLGIGLSGKDYCYNPGGPNYIPGELTVFKEGLRLSTGLDVRKIAIKDQPVQYANGGRSSINFHADPDGAAVFLKNDNSGNYFYVSNSEVVVSGGVGSIEFDANGNVLGYKRVLSGTVNNCGGGRSPYNTWLSCEENNESGFVWEVSPNGDFKGRKTNLVPRGGNYESVAYHFDTILKRNIYYITEDSSSGALVQFTPSKNFGTREEMYSAGKHRFLRMGVGNSGTFSWVLNRNQATPWLYRYAEGIDIKDDFLYFVSKSEKTLFILNLKEGTFTRDSTNKGAFNGEPDQVARIVGSDPANVLYFCEDGGDNCGVHGRSPSGQYVTILDNDPNAASNVLTGETTGLAFSPDAKRMYVAFYQPGIIFEIKRTDGLSFAGSLLDIKYHSVTS